MVTRRRFLLTLPAVAALPRLAIHPAELDAQTPLPFHRKPVPPPPPRLVYFGTDTTKGVSKGIYLAHFDVTTGHLTAPTLAAATARPSYLALSVTVPTHPHLYAVNAVGDATATVTSYQLDPASGALKEINHVTSAGAGPCYISLDATGHTAYVANYVGSTLATYHVQPDGSLSQPVVRLDYKDPKFGKRGPIAARQDIPHPYSTHLSPDNRFLLVNDLGSDEISIFAIDPYKSTLSAPTLFTNERPGSGPRHIAFHRNGRWVYSINELDSTIDHFLWTANSSHTDPQGLLVNTGHVVKTIADSFPVAKNTAAEVQISPDGNFLYASNRGEDSLVVFSIGPDDGKLTFLQRISCGGKTPRHFTLDPSGRWILCGNQDSATVTVFRRDGGSGHLTGPTQTVALDSVMFTLFA